MTGIDDDPDIGAARADLVERRADLIVDDAVLDGFSRAVVAAGVERQYHLVEVAALRVLAVVTDRLLGAMAGIIDQHQVAGRRTLAERGERAENGRPGRIAAALGKLRPRRQSVGQHRDVGEATLLNARHISVTSFGGPFNGVMSL